MPTPRTLAHFNKTVLPLLHKTVRSQRILNDIAHIVKTDRWNSFDQFHKTTQTLVRAYKTAGAKAEVYTIPTGGPIGSGRWIIHEAADIRGLTIDITHPIQQRLLDYKQNPWHAVQWSAATAAEGQVNELIVIDTENALKKVRPNGLSGKMVLTKLDARQQMKGFADKGAAGIIIDRPLSDLPGATPWTKFGWGGISISDAASQLVAAVLSEREGIKLRELIRKHGPLTLKTRADVHRYAGTHDLVSGLVLGQNPQDEIWALAHSAEPGAHDNASGVALCLEIARTLESLIAAGKLPRPKRTIRLLHGYECYSFFHYTEHVRRLQTPLAGVCIDTVGAKPAICDGQLSWRSSLPMSATFVDRVGAAILNNTLRLHNPGYKLAEGPFVSTSDTLLGDPQYGFPCPWLTTHYRKEDKAWKAYHSSADTLNVLSPAGLKTCATAMAGYLYYLANAGNAEIRDLANLETRQTLTHLADKPTPNQAAFLREQHHASLERLKRWIWGKDRSTLL
ncbi:MAG: M28 family peptidase, partial [bacterium]|nr:M28 family peptidase [bacterium]